MSDDDSVPGPMSSFSIRSRILSSSGSATSPTVTATETAMQRWPAEP